MGDNVIHTQRRQTTARSGIDLATPTSLRISSRDRQVIDLALSKLRGASVDFGETVRALREAVEECIPGGRVFFLGTSSSGPIIGSIISGVGIVDSPAGVQIVRVKPGQRPVQLDRFSR